MQPGTTIFEQMSGLARAHDAINLGQGFPDFGWPAAVLAAGARAITSGDNQYPPMRGLPELRRAVAAFYRRRQGLDLDPDQVIVTSGATEALAASILSVAGPGDEVILFAPAYDAYAPLVRRAGAQPVFVDLAPPDWQADASAITAAITPATRAILLNTPHNPTGAMAGPAMLAAIVQLARAHDLLIISDEVWEEVLTGAEPHVSPLALAPERTIKIGSAGKLLALTGWKVGWVVAEAGLAERVAQMHQFLTFTTPPPLQQAVAEGLALPDAWFAATQGDFRRARDRLAAALASGGWTLLPSVGSYFLMADLAASGIGLSDSEFCMAAVARAGVAAIPLGAFLPGTPASGFIRLCFAKRDTVLDAGASRLNAARRTDWAAMPGL
ncbi:aminotransferase class I/II-fold pyridoxal phosphate-dependent enzyme [Sandarakinorhabdus rubra]|uniref:aminotransferase class I/II-fold pyridoxal phosphate-dependent enzyme n=1 Tax=Sandarakinorhabdus rubra TaxID=2672568 RepID=UPI0013DC4679|nr:aminotransferase class I/II-fold pyridoxal phosphate-dependent enzyme [Sandarakinorhabdus rubra]